jgi:dehydrogenase/reductase SDR family protein 12
VTNRAPCASSPWRLAGAMLATCVDPVIPLAFGAPGFVLRSSTFDRGDLDVDMSGRRVVITGATSGLGFEAASALARLGAEVEIVCRDEARGEQTARTIRETTGNRRVSIILADLSDLTAVRAAARALALRPVHVLIHNAGLLPARRFETAQGLELTFATHVVGPYLMTAMLRAALASTGDARVVWVSSGGMYTHRLNLADPNWNARIPYDGVIAYAETKRAQVILAELWAERLRAERIVVNSMHPGWADTPGVQSSLPRFQRVLRPLLRTPAQGADTIVWLAASQPAGHMTGKFVFDRVARRTHLWPGTRETEHERRRLWELCEKSAEL